MSQTVIYTAQVLATGGRDGTARGSDGKLDVRLSRPGTGDGTNPEQLFAAGWAACFINSMEVAARRFGVALPADRAVDAEVDLCHENGAYWVQARLAVKLPGLDRDTALKIVQAGEEICPYSKATRGNIQVAVTLIDPEA